MEPNNQTNTPASQPEKQPRPPRQNSGRPPQNGGNRRGGNQNGGTPAGGQRRGGGRGQGQGQGGDKQAITGSSVSRSSRGQAVRAQKRLQMDATKMLSAYSAAQPAEQRRANVIVDDAAKLKITFLGGQYAIGE